MSRDLLARLFDWVGDSRTSVDVVKPNINTMFSFRKDDLPKKTLYFDSTLISNAQIEEEKRVEMELLERQKIQERKEKANGESPPKIEITSKPTLSLSKANLPTPSEEKSGKPKLGLTLNKTSSKENLNKITEQKNETEGKDKEPSSSDKKKLPSLSLGNKVEDSNNKLKLGLSLNKKGDETEKEKEEKKPGLTLGSNKKPLLSLGAKKEGDGDAKPGINLNLNKNTGGSGGGIKLTPLKKEGSGSGIKLGGASGLKLKLNSSGLK